MLSLRSENPWKGLPFHARGSRWSVLSRTRFLLSLLSAVLSSGWFPRGHKLTSAGNLGYKLPCSSRQKRREALVHPCLTFSALPSVSYLCVCSPTMTVARGLMGSVHCFPDFPYGKNYLQLLLKIELLAPLLEIVIHWVSEGAWEFEFLTSAWSDCCR